LLYSYALNTPPPMMDHGFRMIRLCIKLLVCSDDYSACVGNFQTINPPNSIMHNGKHTPPSLGSNCAHTLWRPAIDIQTGPLCSTESYPISPLSVTRSQLVFNYSANDHPSAAL